MSRAILQIRVHRVISLLFCCVALWSLTGCPAPEVLEPEDLCDEVRRCGVGSQEVCGEDGQTYSCESYARCLGVSVDTTGEACELTSECGPVTCDLYCENGYKSDANGCNLCECNEPVECPAIDCDLYCENGVKTDEHGCDLCECNEPVECAPVACNLFCADGFKTDEDGCDLCECNEPYECPEFMEPHCEAWQELKCYTDRDGCESCECAPSNEQCVYEVCHFDTESVCFGDNDGDGCEECACVEPGCPYERDAVECPEGSEWECIYGSNGERSWACVEEVICPPIAPPDCFDHEYIAGGDLDGDGCAEAWCEPVSCPGYEVPDCGGEPVTRGEDDEGCTVFSCFPLNCPDIDCSTDECEYGVKLDSSGCATCECKAPPVECELLDPDFGTCDLYCANGFEVDANGCEICECKEAECIQDEDCSGINELCVLDMSDPSLCCNVNDPNAGVCPDDVPACSGTCKPFEYCSATGAGCPGGTSCEFIERNDCCPHGAICDSSIPACPAVCM